ncbi:uncharacterized protein LOC129225952 [Uloborus diversus]|uniref:uncharacterized protein LOC129225952 n=1 Tax=Uloborus diversus TaxID=327109 RepID=UPI00240A9698|nr:uncharacterized protein LOC129225952 [Uloborus diversus]
MNVQCSWKASDGRPVADAVNWTDAADINNFEDEIMAENCIMLEAPEKADGAYPTVPACQLLISCQPPNQISHISVFCEARVMEVYGHHGEYLKTIRTTLLEEAEDMVVFKGDVQLERPLSLCSIKFACLRSPNEMWLYGVKIHLSKSEFDQQNQMSIPLAAVEHRLAEMGLTLSDKAEAFKQLFEKCQKSPVFGLQDIGFFIASLQQSNLVKHKSSSPETLQVSKTLDSLMKCADNRDSQNNVKEEVKEVNSNYQTIESATISTSPILLNRSETGTQTDEEYLNLENKLKTYINEQIMEMDRNMWEKINKRFQETEAKLLCKLDEIESFVKPQGVISS